MAAHDQKSELDDFSCQFAGKVDSLRRCLCTDMVDIKNRLLEANTAVQFLQAELSGDRCRVRLRCWWPGWQPQVTRPLWLTSARRRCIDMCRQCRPG